MHLDPQTYLAFLATTIILFFTPGPVLLLVIGHGVQFGSRKAMATVSGIVAGGAMLLIVLMLGMNTMTALAGAWFGPIRWLGVAYLALLGLQEWRRGAVAEPPTFLSSRSSLFLQGLAVNTTNPQTLVFLAAFLPQFMDPTAPCKFDFAILGLSFLGVDIVLMSLCVVLADRVRMLLLAPRQILWRRRVTALLLIGTGAVLALADT